MLSTSLLNDSVNTGLFDFTHTSSPALESFPCNKHGVDGRNVPAAIASLPAEIIQATSIDTIHTKLPYLALLLLATIEYYYYL